MGYELCLCASRWIVSRRSYVEFTFVIYRTVLVQMTSKVVEIFRNLQLVFRGFCLKSFLEIFNEIDTITVYDSFECQNRDFLHYILNQLAELLNHTIHNNAHCVWDRKRVSNSKILGKIDIETAPNRNSRNEKIELEHTSLFAEKFGEQICYTWREKNHVYFMNNLFSFKKYCSQSNSTSKNYKTQTNTFARYTEGTETNYMFPLLTPNYLIPPPPDKSTIN